MLIQTASIFNISREAYDEFLANGWFRGYGNLYKTEFLCLDEELLSTVHVRLPLEEHRFSKTQRRLMARGDRHFRVTIGKVRITREKQRLYEIHKHRFKAFVHETLAEVVRAFDSHIYLNTHELCVYDGKKLVAVSYFDIGYKSVASILCVFNPEYAAFSPGMYTMFKEIEYVRSLNMHFYYPGYVMDKSDSFHYKLRAGHMQWLAPGDSWKPWEKFTVDSTKAHTVREKTRELEEFFTDQNIPFKRKLYPFYSTGLMWESDERLLRYPLYLQWQDGLKRRFAAYDIELEQYVTGIIRNNSEYDFFSSLILSDEYLRSEVYQLEILVMEEFSYLAFEV